MFTSFDVMLDTYEAISPHIKLKFRNISTDNLAFKFHYRFTFIILIVSTLLVTSREFIGEHIRCITDGSIPSKVIDTFCFFTPTYTVVRHLNESMLQRGHIAHPGIGPMNDDEPVQHHAYYQWVPFVLFIQAITFFMPHILWRSWEGGKIKSLVDGLQMVSISKHVPTPDQDIELANNRVVLSPNTVDSRMRTIKIAFYHHIRVNMFWATRLIVCECLNMINILFQIQITHLFLGNRFYALGLDFIRDDFSGIMDSLDAVFPKVTKCNFYKYGASGSIQRHDALCVMALNVINEKIFIFLWFWYLIVAGTSIMALLWRLLTMIMHSRSSKFNSFVFSMVCPGRLNPWDMITVTHHSSYSDWLFLYYLAKNMEPYLFREMIISLASEMRQADNGGICMNENIQSHNNKDAEQPTDNSDEDDRKTSICVDEDVLRTPLYNNDKNVKRD